MSWSGKGPPGAWRSARCDAAEHGQRQSVAVASKGWGIRGEGSNCVLHRVAR